MLSTAFQIVAIVGVTAFLYHCRAAQHRRNTQSWDSLLARLRPGWNARVLCEMVSAEDAHKPTLREKWTRIRGADSLWAMYRNAGVMMEMADYAARNSDSVAPEILRSLRSDAMRIRILILQFVVKYAASAAAESVLLSALRAESAFAEMQLYLTEVLQANVSEVAPAFVAAM